jgi:predicted RNA-binding protein with EMAP domain
MEQQKEKIVEALNNVQAAIQELENYIEPTNHNSNNWIKELTNRTENIKNDLFRIKP